MSLFPTLWICWPSALIVYRWGLAASKKWRRGIEPVARSSKRPKAAKSLYAAVPLPGSLTTPAD
jgi:hypothetical protein